MSWRRVALGSAAAAAIVALAATLVVRNLSDPGRIKRLAQEKARAAWSRELGIGEVQFDLFPLPSLRAHDLVLSNPGWARSRPFLTAKDAVARLSLLPLLAGQVRIKSVALEHATLDLETGPGGARSWSLASTGTRPSGGGPALLEITGVQVSDADIWWRTQGAPPVPWHIDFLDANGSAGLRDVGIEVHGARRGHPLAVKARFSDLSRWGVAGAGTDAEAVFDWGTTRLAIKGHIPVDGSAMGQALHADLESSQLNDLLAFFDIARRPTAPVQVHFDAREVDGATQLEPLSASLGAFKIQGEARVHEENARTVVEARIAGNRLDWPRALLDAGTEPPPPLEAPEMFQDTPLAWHLLASLTARGSMDATFESVRLRSGVEMRNFATKSTFDGDRWDMGSFSAQMLGGTATGSFHAEAKKKTARMRFEGKGLLLERWYRERGSAIPFKGGPMTVSADVRASGDSMRALAASLTGPVTIRLTKGALAMEKAGAAEAKLVEGKEQGRSGIEFDCISANLPFQAGLAERSPLIAARSNLSYLITSGDVDFRNETVELRGRVKPLHPGNVAMASIAGDVLISGPIRKPHIEHDPVKTPMAVARGAAAIATLGLSALATASSDAAEAKQNDPCAAVF